MSPDLPDRYPLAPLQRGMLFHAVATPGSTMYVEQYRYRLEGDLDLAAFTAAWDWVCQRHPVLRTGFGWEEADRPWQAVRPRVEPPLEVSDWRGAPQTEQAARLRALASAERQRGFDLSRAPLFRVRLVRLADRTWQLLWTHHHLILDGWSAGLVLHEVGTAYDAARRGVPVSAPPAPAYHDFVTWVTGQDLAPAREYWTGVLAGFTEPTELGITRAGGPGGGGQQRIGRCLPPELSDRLRRFAQERDLTVDTVLAAAWAMVLGRYSRCDDVLFGVTLPGRHGGLPGLERMAGLLISTLPVRVRLDGGQPIGSWLAALQADRERAHEVAHTPLDRVQAWSDVPAGRPLFDSILVVEDFPFDHPAGSRLGELAVTASESTQQTNYPLTLLAFPREQLVIEALFDPGVVDPRLVGNLLGHLANVLDGLTAARVLDDVELMSAAERAALLRRGGPRESSPVGGSEPVPVRFAGWVRRQPDRVAVSYCDRHVTYRELGAQVARLAHRLRGMDVGPGKLVGICLPRGVDMVAAALAVACAGGGYVPVDHRDPARRVRAILDDAAVAVLLTSRDMAAAGAFEAGGRHTLCLDDPLEQQRLCSLPDTLPHLDAGPDDVAYVIFTSGSTGAPKGVVVEHRQLARLFDATRGWFEFGRDDVWTLFHSIAFDFSVWELWGALAGGGRLVVVPEELTRDPGGFRELLLAGGVTVLNQTPSSFRSLMHAWPVDAPVPPRLRHVIFGGEMLDVSSLQPWLDRYGDQRPRLVNMYGITETTVHVTYRPILRSDLEAGVPSPIGEPIPDLAIRLTDPEGRLVPVGVPGEVHVAGAGVARGYLHRPELTAARFLDTPEEPDPGSRRWYRTGDLARWLPDAGLEFLGRVDDQVKIRGYRIELGEIESVLNGHPGIRESVVAARPTGTEGHRRLVAYAVPEGGAPLAWPAVRSWLSERLPDHMVPSGLVSLERLPLTRNGKVDRRALPDPDPGSPDRDGQVAPRSDLERMLVEIWAEVLGREHVGITDNFFELGGDSILTIQVVSRAARRGVSLTPAQLFAHQTIAGLARVAALATGATAEAEQGEVTGEVPATPARVWFERLALPHPGWWNLPVLLLAREPVQLEWLTQALDALVAHHDMLRLRVERGRHRIASIAEHGTVPVRAVDLTATGPHQLGSRIDELARELPAGFDLTRGPLVRAALLQTPSGQPDRVLLVAHHLVVDTVSWQTLLEDLNTAYRQLTAGGPVRLPPKATDVPRWARGLAELAASDQVAEQAGWWLSRLPEQAPALPVEGDRDAPCREADSDTVTGTLDEVATEALLTTAHRAYRTRPEELLLAALAQAFRQWTGEPGLLVDLEGHGRDVAMEGVDVSRTVGWFTTFTTAWLDLSGSEPGPAAVIKAVKEQLRAMPRREVYSLARWLRDDDVAHRLSELPPAQVSFNYLGRLDQGAAEDTWFTPAPEPPGGGRHPDNPSPYLIDVVLGVRNGRLQVYLGYSTRHHSRTTMNELAAAYLEALRVLIDHCLSPRAGGATPSDFPLAQVSQRQLDRLVAERGPIEDLYPLAPLQRGLLFHTLANPGSGVYFEQFSIRLDGAVDLHAFEQAWQALLGRHEVLRAGIAWQGLAVPHLVVHSQVELPLAHDDWHHLPEQEQAARLADLLARDRAQGFELTAAPLTRLVLIRLGPRRWHLVWSHHHILLDGWSVALLIQEVFDTYEAIRTGDYRPPPRPRPYRDYVGYLATLDHAGAWAYWRRVLSGVTGPTPLGTDRPAVPTGRRDADYARVYRRLPRDRSEAVRELARSRRLTLDTLLHGAWALVLSQLSGQDDVVFGVTSSGRPPTLAGVEEMVGLFINTLPARVRVSRDQPVGTWLAGLLRDQVQAREFEHTPLDQIRSWTSIPPDRPLFDSGRGLENYPMDGSRFRTGSVSISDIQTFEQSHYALSFVVVPDEELFLQLWYDALRFSGELADRMLRLVEALLDAFAGDPERTVGEVLAGMAAPLETAAPPEVGDAPLPRLVETWAAAAPERTAVRAAGGASLSYRELDKRANQVAAWLHEHAAGPGSRVGLALPRGVDWLVALLGILKTGAACVPLPAGGPPVWDQLEDAVRPSLCLAAPGSQQPGGRVVPFDPDRLDAQPAGPPDALVGLADAAVLAWWSRPDGTICATGLSHGELTRHARARSADITGRDVVAQLAELGTEVAAREVWAALANGATLYLGPLPDPAVTVVTLSGRELAELVDHRPSALDGVRLLWLRGDLPAAHARRLRVRQPSLRIEPAAELDAGRVAHALRRLPGVREVVVAPVPDRRHLAAYLVPDTSADEDGAGSGGSLARQHVAHWQVLYDRTYAESQPDDPTFNTAGWNSSYTGAPLPAEAMAEWRRVTLERIRALGPARVLEIGCGTGLLLFGLIDDCDEYVGTDFSPVCLAQVQQHLEALPAAARAKVALLERAADDFAGLAPGSFDVVVLNSVVQYFPGPRYLTQVLEGALRVAAPDGAVFLGDVRHHGLREAFHASVELYRAVDMLPVDELSARVSRSMAQERELLVDPTYLTAFATARPEVGAVEVMPRRGRHDTELTRYRYDAVLRLGPPPPEPEGVHWYDWHRDVLSPSEIGWLLDHAAGDTVGVTGVPNARLAADVQTVRLLSRGGRPRTVGELRLAAGKAPAGMDPDELYQLGASRGWSVAVSLAVHRSDGSLNALFQRGQDRPTGVHVLHVAGADGSYDVATSGEPASGEPTTREPTSRPLHLSLLDAWEREAWRALRDHLPADVSVGRVLVVDELPRTPDGQVDEAALPVPADVADATAAGAGESMPPRTADELRLARIWERALRVRSVDIRTSFFDLGGDSLLALRVIDEAARVFGQDVPLGVLLQEPTIEGMAAALRATPVPWSPLVEINPGEETPFFCVHPAGGGVLCYAELARLLSPQPFYALQARGVDGDDPPYRDVAEMAARYLADVRGRQPTGPYLLGGYSMGGLVAYEMAQQLAGAGQQVALLVLIDTPTPQLIDELPDEAAMLVRLLDGTVPLDPEQLRAMPADERLGHVLREAERAQVVPPGMDPGRARHLFDVYAAHLTAARRYRPRPYDGRTCLLRAAQTRPGETGRGWDGLLTGQWEAIEVPGDHETLVWSPNVQRLAEVIQVELRQALSPAGSGPGGRAARAAQSG